MMNREEIILQLRQFFQVRELVCDHTFSQWGERSWQFLDTAYLHNLLVIRRDILQMPMTCNHDGAKQRGLRCNRCQLVKEKGKVYLSAHVLGRAGDFSVQGMTAQEARSRIRNMAGLLPYPLRMEGRVSWLHIDTLPQYGINTKVYEFSA
jgi:hypothetical protein